MRVPSDIAVRRMLSTDARPLSEAFAAAGWHKPETTFLTYVDDHDSGDRECIVAHEDGQPAGYVTLRWISRYEPFAREGVPEICDLNVLPARQRRGIGSTLLDAVERIGSARSTVVGIGVGLFRDYGAAQRIYVKRGYVPDGRGIVYDYRAVVPGESVPIDDSACLMLSRNVRD